MFSLLQGIGPEIPLSLLLLALLGHRSHVTPRAWLTIKAAPEKIFAQIDVIDGQVQSYGRTQIEQFLVDPVKLIFKFIYTTTIIGGVANQSTALFRVSEREPGKRLVLVREGIEPTKTNNELLKIVHDIEALGDSSRLTTTYYWGPRASFAQVVARADLWGGIYRLRSIIETGIPSESAYAYISCGVAVVTGIISFLAFSLLMGPSAALIVILALFVHEFGHLLAYRLMGQPWGRMLFLPFLGGIAIPRLPFSSQGQAVFAALMGPGLSVLLAVACSAPLYWSSSIPPLLAVIGLITVAINIFNLLPAEPLDGGIALRSVTSRFFGSYARFALLGAGALVVALGFLMSQILLVVFGGLAILANIKERKIDAGLSEMSTLQAAISVFCYAALAAAYMTLLGHFLEHTGIGVLRS